MHSKGASISTVNTVYMATDGMVAEQQAMTNLSSNLANVNTPGFLELVTANVGDPVGSVERVGGTQPTPISITPPIAQGVAAETAWNVQAASSTPTGVASDVAISAGGFLTMRTAHGVAYTRNGTLHVSPTGVLTTATGDPVLSTAGVPIHLQGTRPWTVSASGVITQAGRPDQTLAIHTLTGTLTDLGNATYQGTAGAWHGSVQSGAVTTSNVSLNQTMASLVQAQSSYSANADVFNEEATRLAEIVTLAQPAGSVP